MHIIITIITFIMGGILGFLLMLLCVAASESNRDD